ncbi:MAG: alpha/beta hydrolase [Pseudomonadota bacterium]
MNKRNILWRLLGYASVGLLVLFMIPRFFIDRFIYFPEAHHEFRPDDFKLPYEDISLTTDDGVKLHAWWIGDHSMRKTVLFFHGNAGNISHRLDRINLLGQPKIRFFLLDYRGYGQSQGKPSEEGFYRDATAVYQYLRAQSVSPENIFLFGESLGGAVATELATRVPIAGLILESTFTSVRGIASIHYPFIPNAFVPDQFNSMARISNVHAKLLVIHGNQDEIAPFSMGKHLYETANQPKSFLEIPGAGHNDLYLVGGRPYRKQILRFLEIN